LRDLLEPAERVPVPIVRVKPDVVVIVVLVVVGFPKVVRSVRLLPLFIALVRCLRLLLLFILLLILLLLIFGFFFIVVAHGVEQGYTYREGSGWTRTTAATNDE
jgi:hypothetical protein